MTTPDTTTRADLEAAHRRSLLLVPALVSTVLSLGLVAFGLLSSLLPVLLVGPASEMTDVQDLTYLPPTATERAIGLAWLLVPILLVAGLLAATWAARARGRGRTTWLTGTAAVLVGVLSLAW